MAKYMIFAHKKYCPTQFKGCVDITSMSALSSDHLVSIFMSTLQFAQLVGITLSNPCVTVHTPWQILRPGLLYFILSVDLKAGKLSQEGFKP